MIDQQILIAIAQVAITLAGFSGVVATFSGSLPEQKLFELKTLLQQSGIALFASLTTLIFSSADSSLFVEDQEGFWVVSSCIYIAICTTFLVFLIPQFVKRQQHKTISYDSIFYLSFVGVIIMLAVNALFVKDAYLYSIALMVNLGYGFMTFVRLVMPSKDS